MEQTLAKIHIPHEMDDEEMEDFDVEVFGE
jgi:hypothetical protein